MLLRGEKRMLEGWAEFCRLAFGAALLLVLAGAGLRRKQAAGLV